MTIFPQRLRIGIDIIHILQNVHPQSPVLSPTERWHILFAHSLGVKQNTWSTDIASCNHRLVRLSWCLLHCVIRLQLFISILIPSAGKFISIILHKLQLLLQFSRIPPIVTITKSNISALCSLYTNISCYSSPTILFSTDNLYTVIYAFHLV